MLREWHLEGIVRPAKPGSYSRVVPRSGNILPPVGAQLCCANGAPTT